MYRIGKYLGTKLVEYPLVVVVVVVVVVGSVAIVLVVVGVVVTPFGLNNVY